MKEKEKKPTVLTIVLIVLLVAAIAVIAILMLHKDKPEDVPTVIGGGEPIPEAQNVPKDVGNTHLPA